MITIISLLFLVLTQPQEIIYEIDRGEAEFYRLFTDVDSFISAKFYSVEDSIQILFSYIAKGDTVDSLVNVSKSVFEGLQFYQKNFYKIITDLNFRKEFIKNYEIDWPIISTKDLAKDKKTALLSAFFNSACCITGTGATGAYIGALVGRSIQKETGYIPCGSQEYSCMIPYEYYSYTLNKTKYYTGVGIGIAGGTIASKMLYFKNWKKNVLFNTLAIEKGKELDHLATIERIKQKRNIIHKNK